MRWDDLCKWASEAKCREAAKLRLEAKSTSWQTAT